MRTPLVFGALAALASAQRTFLVNEAPGGGTPPQGAGICDLSQDGRYVVFDSKATVHVAGDTNAASDVFLRDRQTGQFELISVASSGVQGALASTSPRITPDARYVAFASASKNLVAPNDAGDFDDVFVRDRQLGTTVKASVTPSGGEASGHCRVASITNDGTRVAFGSAANDLFPGDPYAYEDIFVRDLALGTTTLVSRSLGGSVGNNHSYVASISGDGGFIAFTSDATDLIAGDTNAKEDIYVANVLTGVIARASVSTSGAQGDNTSHVADISDDGRFVTFHSTATNLAGVDVPPWQDIFVRDMQAGVTTRVSQSASGTPANYSSWYPTLSSDGRYVTFVTYADNLLPQPSHRHGTVRVDRTTGAVSEVGGSACGVPLDQLGMTRISSDGAQFVFLCKAAHVVPNDVNNTYDVFLHDMNAPSIGSVCTYCVVGATSNGCLPSMSFTGTPSASAGSGFVLTVNSVEGQRTAMFLFSPYSVSVPWGAGARSYRCVDTFWGRFGHQSSTGTTNQCDGTLVTDANAWWQSWMSPGAEAYVQAWFRDPAAPARSHFSEALSMVVGP